MALQNKTSIPFPKPALLMQRVFSVTFKRFSRLRGIAVVTLMTVLLSVLYLTFATPSTAYAVTNATLNFQARLESSSGAIAPDGTYNLEFKLYSASSGGTAEWTEDYTYNSGPGSSDARIHVANGYMTVNLGSITAFPNTINWGTPQYLTMNIGGTVGSGTITWDGEMSPRLPLTAVPTAFSLESNVNASGYNSNLTLTQPGSGVTTGNENFVVQDQGAAGTYSLLTGGSISGATAGVVLQSSSPGTQQSGNFNISGTGLLATLDATGGAGSTLTIGGGDVATGSINIGGSTTSGTITVGNTSETGAATLQVEGLSQTLIGSATAPSDTVKTTTNSTTAFQVQNSSGNNVFSVDTSTGTGQVILGSSSHNNGQLTFDNSAGPAQISLATTASNTTGYTIDLPTAAPTTGQCLGTSLTSATQLTFTQCAQANTAISVVGSEWDEDTGTTTTLTTVPATKGDMIMLGIQLGSSGSVAVSGVSGGGVTTWTKVTSSAWSGSTDTDMELYEGTVTTTGSQTVTVTHSGSSLSSQELVADEFTTAGVSPSTTWDVMSTGTNSGTNATVTMPSLTTTVSQELYFGYAENANSMSAGSGTGPFTYIKTTFGDGVAYYTGTAGATSYQPTYSQGSSGSFNVAAGLIMAFNSNSSYIDNATTVQQANMDVQAAASGSVAATLQANVAGTGDILDLLDGSGHVTEKVTSTGNMLVAPSTNSTTALQVQNFGGTSTVLDVDTTDGYVGIGTNSPSRPFDVDVNNTQVAAPMSLLEQDGTGDSSMEFKDPNNSIYIGQDADGSDAFVVSSSIAASHNRAGSPYDLGYTSITDSFNDSGNSGLITSMPFTTTLGGTTNQITVDFSTGAGDNFEVAIYADSGSNYPGALLATSASTAITGTNGSNNWDTATLSSSVTLSPSTKYWLAYETQNGSANYWLDNTKGSTCWQTISGSFGSWTPVSTTACDQGYTVGSTYGIYALVNPIGSSHSITDTFSNPLITMTQSGFTTFEGMSNSTTAFQVDNSSASAVLDVDTVNSQVGIGTSAPSTALQVAVNNTTTNNLPLSLQQTGTGNTGLQFTTTSGSIYEGEDTDGTYRISSSTAASSDSSIIGDNAIGPTNNNGNLGSLDASQFVATSTGTLTTLNAYIYTVGSGATNHGEMALYSDSAASPHTLLANSSSTVLTANSWNSFSIPSTSVTAGTNYWLVFEADSSTTGFASTTANVQYPTVVKTHTYSSALPATWGSSTSTAYGVEGSMYASILSSSSGTDSLSSGGNNVATLGKTSGTATDTGDGSNINCSQFTPSVGGTTNYMTVAMGTTSSSGISYSFGIYTGTSTVPQTKVATSTTGTLNTVQGLQSLPISATLTAGTLYWLCANSSAASGASSDYTYNPTDGVPTWFISRTFSSGWPATMGTGTTATGSIDMSVNYTITTSTNGLLRMTSTGQTTLQNVSNSINAFQIQDSSGGTAFNVDTADDFVGIGTATPHAQLEVTGDVYLGTQTLTANDQADVCLFGNTSCTAAQAGAFNNQLKIFGGSGSANDLFLYQAAGGNAYVGSSTANLVIETTSSNANILLEPNGSGQVISDTIVAFDPNSPGNAESWHNFSLSSGFSAGTDVNGTTYNPAYRLLPDGDVELSGVVNITATYSSPATFTTIPSQYRPSTYVISCTVSNNIGNTMGQVILRPNGNVQIHTSNYTSGWTFNLDGCILPLYGR